MKKQIPIGEEIIKYSGNQFEIIHQDFQFGDKFVTFEIARRSPGVRLIIINKENKILLSKEYRTELEEFDYRLPGGKVFDSREARKNADLSKIKEYAEKAAKIECLEETGLIANNPKLYKISKSGSSIQWDLYYFIIEDFRENKDGQQLDFGEVITTDWYTIEEIINLSKNGNIKEDRSLGVIFKFLLEKNLLK